MRGGLQRRDGGRIVRIDLHALEDLERSASVLSADDEGSASGFTLIPYHATDAHRAVEFGTDEFGQSGIGNRRQFYAQDVAEEGNNLFFAEAQGPGSIRSVKFFKV